MPLTEAEKQGRRSMTTENRVAADVYRIAEALERIEQHLRAMNERAATKP